MHRSIAALIAVLAAACCWAAPAAAATPNLSGTWLVSDYTPSSYQLQQSADGSTLKMSWAVGSGALTELVGHFTGTLDPTGTFYSGRMNVGAGSDVAHGTMTVAITQQQKFGDPLLAMSYQADNGTAANVTLQIWLAAPQTASGRDPRVAFGLSCPGPGRCRETAELLQGTTIVGSTQVNIAGGQVTRVRIRPNKAGRKLLAKRGPLHAHVLLIGKSKSDPLPYQTDLGAVTLTG